MLWRTRILLGSTCHDNYIDGKVWELVKEFASLPPAHIRYEQDILRYEVPRAHISGFQDNDRMHYVEANSRLERIRTEAVQRMSSPVVLRMKKPILPRDYNQLTVYREQVFPDSFLLKEEAQFSHVEYIHERIVSTMTGWEYVWKTTLQRQWVCPYSSLTDESLVFRCKPMYSIYIDVDDLPSLDLIQKFINTAMPSYLTGEYECVK